MNVTFTPTALDDLRYWLKTDKRQAERVLALLEEIRRTPFEGTGKPEPLRFQLAAAGHAGSTGNIGLSTKWKKQKS